MNKLGQMTAIGSFIILFVGIIVALSLFTGGITSNIGIATEKSSIVNQTVAFPANGATLVLTGQAATDVVITNATAQTVVSTSNYTITNYDVSTGTLRSVLTVTNSPFAGKNVNVSYVYEPLGYARESSTRSVIELIAVFAALAVLAFVVKKIYDDGLFDKFGR